MKKIFRLLPLLMLWILVACSTDTITGSTNSNDRDESEKLTQSQSWDGPEQDGVVSSDNLHCRKSDIAKELDFPGYVNIQWPEGRAVYHSTEEIIKLNTNFEETGYRLENFSLWKEPGLTDKVFLGKYEGESKPEEVLVYELGGCE